MAECVDMLTDLDLPRTADAKVRIAGKTYIPGADRGVATLLTAASWVLQRLPGQRSRR